MWRVINLSLCQILTGRRRKHYRNCLLRPYQNRRPGVSGVEELCHVALCAMPAPETQHTSTTGACFTLHELSYWQIRTQLIQGFERL